MDIAVKVQIWNILGLVIIIEYLSDFIR